MLIVYCQWLGASSTEWGTTSISVKACNPEPGKTPCRFCLVLLLIVVLVVVLGSWLFHTEDCVFRRWTQMWWNSYSKQCKQKWGFVYHFYIFFFHFLCSITCRKMSLAVMLFWFLSEHTYIISHTYMHNPKSFDALEKWVNATSSVLD